MVKKCKQDISTGHIHDTCAHVIPCTDRHLSNQMRPLLGRCPYKENMFLLNEFTNCPHYEKRAEEDA